MTGRLRRALRGRRPPPDRDDGHPGTAAADGGRGERIAEHGAPSLAHRMTPSWCVGRIAGDVAHDLNNHLQIVLGSAELLGAAGGLPSGARRQLERIVDAGRLASAASGSLLALAREAEASPAPAAGSPPDVTLGDVIGSLTERLSRLAGAGATLATALDAGARTVPIARVRGGDALPELLACLVVHAAAGLSAGTTVTLHVRLSDEDPATLRLHVEIGRAHAAARGSGRRRAGRTGSDGAPPVGKPSLAVDVLALLAERAGGRLLHDAPPPAHGGVAAALTVEREAGSP